MPPDTGATVQSLPTELLEFIFLDAVVAPFIPQNPHNHNPLLPLFSKLPHAPLLQTALTQVCHQWRSLALQMPNLWTHLHISRSALSHRRLGSSLGRSFNWLPAYLSRALALPLHITLDCTHLPLEPLMHILAPTSPRWVALTVLVSHVGTLPPVLHCLENIAAPTLESLTISADIYRSGIVSASPLPPFFTHGTPRLSSLILNRVYINWRAPPLSSSLSIGDKGKQQALGLALTELVLGYTTWWPAFPILDKMFAAMPALQRLVITDEIAPLLHNVDQPKGRPTICLPSLLELEIEVYHPRLRTSLPPQYSPPPLARGRSAMSKSSSLSQSQFHVRESAVRALLGLFSLPLVRTLAFRNLGGAEWEDVRAYVHERTDEGGYLYLRRVVLESIGEAAWGEMNGGRRVYLRGCNGFEWEAEAEVF